MTCAPPPASARAPASLSPEAPSKSPSKALPPAAPHSPAWRRWAAPAALVLVAAAAWAAFGDRLSFQTLADNREALIAWRDAAPLRAAAVYVAVYAAAVAVSLPGALALTLTGGFLFGLAAGTGLTALAATAGATAIFLVARSALGARLEARLAGRGGFMARLRAGAARNQVSVLLLLRLVPAVPFFLANLAPAFLGVRAATYVWTTFVGILPGTAVYTWVGAGLGEVFDRGEAPDLGIVFTWPVLGPLAGLCLLAALPMVLRALRGRDTEDAA
ncbi:MAG: VTT domain-containing protein [Pseudomonadota bacterium]|nr:VTT domain-containing protein [Pseudomonadota bacterium]